MYFGDNYNQNFDLSKTGFLIILVISNDFFFLVTKVLIFFIKSLTVTFTIKIKPCMYG